MATVLQECIAGEQRETRTWRPFVRNAAENAYRQAKIAMPAVAYKPTEFVPQAIRAVFGLLRKRDCKPKWTPKAGLPSRAEGGHAVPNIVLSLVVFSDSDTRRAQNRLKNPCFQVLQ